ncbi:MAG: NYN domain-containing protein [Candidatus Pacebacteria bacterium]|jgi:hypothetical protein|nr:NYN domain-containing protein [Candidatus Paceibacterota bacterium]MBT3511713.1 NYN domain-containing protein [Candidatus Paceibacterota bacterium]MBT4005142.1 NYN domain-containing protein [Candidatus Paceibacterota bacterium]MBT4358599.1 NYN domain-containing protein [Candidatus Paceibacterota bacterium]MBT4680739.1 NYN domain-containing protein [Candidatus Paceibacterota bacterium]
MKKIILKDLDTYVYLDSSNIRNALRVVGVKLDFIKLYKYLNTTYKHLKTVKYFEGADVKNKKAAKQFKLLEKTGYKMHTLVRKSYQNKAKYRSFKCGDCDKKNTVEILKKSKTLKSNVDVYLCSELMGDLLNVNRPFHIIIFSCDGDFSEMIENMLKKNKHAHITVIATPFTKHNNYLSIRLKQLERVDRYYLANIINIKDKIKK